MENFCGGVRVTIERTNFIKVSHGGNNVVDKLTERQQVMLEIIRQFVIDHVVEGVVEDGVEVPTANSIAKQLQTSPRTIQRELAYLQSQKVIRRVGADFGGYWEIIEAEK